MTYLELNLIKKVTVPPAEATVLPTVATVPTFTLQLISNQSAAEQRARHRA